MKDHWAQLLGNDTKPASPRKKKPAKDVSDVAQIRSSSNDVENNREDLEMRKALLNPPKLSPMMSLEDANRLNEAMKQMKESRASRPDGEVQQVEKKGDVQAMERVIESIKYKVPKGHKRVPWIETLSITVNRSFVDEKIETREDHRRETLFHDAAMSGVLEGLSRVHSIGLPFTRPTDFFADMLKSDHQMYKVKTKLATEQAKIHAVENRKKVRLDKKFAKKVRADKIKSKQQTKNKNLKAIEEWKKSKFKKPL